jgi:hypothetical protein
MMRVIRVRVRSRRSDLWFWMSFWVSFGTIIVVVDTADGGVGNMRFVLQEYVEKVKTFHFDRIAYLWWW